MKHMLQYDILLLLLHHQNLLNYLLLLHLQPKFLVQRMYN
tara:strand:+ start:425 stop:544 length:120 start_codon:yes stop_codon:yes gene_type:complete